MGRLVSGQEVGSNDEPLEARCSLKPLGVGGGEEEKHFGYCQKPRDSGIEVEGPEPLEEEEPVWQMKVH